MIDHNDDAEGYDEIQNHASCQGRGECLRCGDPLPADGRCDCAGDPERDAVTGHRELAAHPIWCRAEGGEWDGEILEVWA